MRHKHADLIKQWVEDTTQVVEWKDHIGNWTPTKNPLWEVNTEYRFRHKHQDLIDQKAARPELIVEIFDGSDWVAIPNPSWDPKYKYRLVEPEKKKVEMWQWIVKSLETEYVYPTLYYYLTAAHVNKDFNPKRFQIIQRADWTRIEVEE